MSNMLALELRANKTPYANTITAATASNQVSMLRIEASRLGAGSGLIRYVEGEYEK